MPLRPIRYEEDRTGLNPNNLVAGEEHLLPVVGKRFLVTKRGPYFSESIIIFDKVSGRRLVPHIDFVCLQLEEEQTILSGKEVCSVVVILADDVTQAVLITYQAYGGWLSYSVTAVIEMIEALNLDEREIQWSQIVGIPDRLPPAPHRHPLSDIYGWHKLFPGLGAIRDAIITGNQPLLDAFREGIQVELDAIYVRISQTEQLIYDHANSVGNVHNLHIHQINGLLEVEVVDLITGLRNQETQRQTNHNASGDHDHRYAPLNTSGANGSIRWTGSAIQIWGGTAWRQVWPPLWQN